MSDKDYAPGEFTLGYDGFTGTLTKMKVEHDGTMHFIDTTDISDVAKFNQEEMNSVSRTTRSGDMVRVARLPMLVLLQLKERGILHDKTALKRWLNTEEARPYRTHHYTS